ncbi:uncharacterized protein DS421_17g573710 [Arachis hypogaea]|nr:uncharacterized protein DS421_17g573710 [Arachis hypogaea]
MEGPLNQAKKAEKAVTCCSSYLGALCLEQTGATTVPCLDRTSFSIVVVFVTNWDLQQRVSDLQQAHPALWISGAAACDPSTVGSQRAQLSTWSGQASMVQASNPTKRSLNHVPSPWCPHLSHKLALLNSAD